MNQRMNQSVVLKRRPSGEPTPADFELVEAPAPTPGDGEILCRTRLVSPFARIPICGIISQYNATEMPPGPNWAPVLVNRLLVQGFIISDHVNRIGDFIVEVGGWVREGKIRYREEIVEGLVRAPEAFIGLLRGSNTGKMLVKVA